MKKVMKNQNLNLFGKGRFQGIDNQFMTEGYEALDGLTQLQVKYDKKDMDTLLNELHDSMVGYYLGFELVNTDKHGFDCKYSKGKDIFLESKVVSFSAKTWHATFNDTTVEKAEAFGDEKVWLALSVWESASKLLCICYGQHGDIEKFLKDKIEEHEKNGTIRSTQSISFSTLINTYKFKILSITKTPEELYRILSLKDKKLKNINWENIITTPKTFVDIFH